MAGNRGDARAIAILCPAQDFVNAHKSQAKNDEPRCNAFRAGAALPAGVKDPLLKGIMSLQCAHDHTMAWAPVKLGEKQALPLLLFVTWLRNMKVHTCPCTRTT